MDRLECDRMFVAVMEAGSFAKAAQRLNTSSGQASKLVSRLEEILGARLTETDIRLFVTLVRFDAAYHGLFKTNLRRIADYRHLSAFIITMLAVPGIGETTSIDHIKRGYYSISALNPNGIVPVGPALPFA